MKARRQARTNLEWFHLPFEQVRTAHVDAFKKARLTQVKPATVDRELDLISAVLHKAINSWDYVAGALSKISPVLLGKTSPLCWSF